LQQLQISLNDSNIEKPWNFDKNILTHWLWLGLKNFP
jgi:leucyl/phenylalanyl-tRNA--protein transferase